eukprot:183616_1
MKLRNVYGDNFVETQLLNGYQHVLETHVDKFAQISNLISAKTNDAPCDVSNCHIFKRNNRDRLSNDTQQKLQSIYNISDIHSIVQQQLVDRIHCYWSHKQFNDENVNEMKNPPIHSSKTIVNSKHKRRKKYITNSEQLYSFGIRFFYWKAYLFNEEIYDRANKASKTLGFQSFDNLVINVHPDAKNVQPAANETVHPDAKNVQPAANKTVNLGYWYIPKKYVNIKQELLHNSICNISPVAYSQLLLKAKFYQTSNAVKKLTCVGSANLLYAFYEMLIGSVMNIAHLIAMMVQCNYDTLQRKFRETFRRTSGKETDYSLRERHRNFFWLGRRLRECVECFGMEIDLTPNKKLISVWHGVNQQFTFGSLLAHIKGPFSTTTSYQVALSFCGNKGMILKLDTDIKWILKRGIGIAITLRNDPNGWWEDRRKSRLCAFNCIWLSDYPHESEIFTIGGLYTYQITEILNVASGINYGVYIKAIHYMLFGTSIGGEYKKDKPNSKSLRQLAARLLAHQLYKHSANVSNASEWESCPQYVEDLLDMHCRQIKYVVFPENNASSGSLLNLIKHEFGWVDFVALFALYPNLERIIYNARDKGKQFILNQLICQSILELIKNSQTLASKLNLIEIRLSDDCEHYMAPLMCVFKESISKYNWDIKLRNMDDKQHEQIIKLAMKYEFLVLEIYLKH